MGHVFTRAVITNAADQLMAERGLLDLAQVRKVVLHEVLVDTGVTHLALPAGLIGQLGLRLRRTVEVSTAAGLVDARLFRDACGYFPSQASTRTFSPGRPESAVTETRQLRRLADPARREPRENMPARPREGPMTTAKAPERQPRAGWQERFYA